MLLSGCLQVIGTLPLLLNPAALGGGATTHTLPLQGLQLQTIAPQLLFNAQGQVVATLGGGATAAAMPTPAAMLPKVSAAAVVSKPSLQVESPQINPLWECVCVCVFGGWLNRPHLAQLEFGVGGTTNRVHLLALT